MSDLRDLISPQAILPRLTVASRRQALAALTDALAPTTGVEARTLFEAVLLRERLSGTGIGEGAALPHARVPGLARAIAGFARLDPAIDFGALDGRPADLVLMLLAPAEWGGEHLKALARISRFLKRAETREKLRDARGVEDLRIVFATTQTLGAA